MAEAGLHLDTDPFVGAVEVAWRHVEAAQEADGLRTWNGDGAVRLHAVEEFDDTTVLLVERCSPGVPLSSRSEREQDAVIEGLLRRLWQEPATGHRFRSLQVMCEELADEFEQKWASGRGGDLILVWGATASPPVSRATVDGRSGGASVHRSARR